MGYISAAQLESVVNAQKGVIAGKIAQTAITAILDNTSTAAQIASAKTVYDFVTNLGGGIKFSVVTELPATGENGTIYLVASDADTYTQHIYTDGSWHDLGGVTANLSNYWSKTELTVATDEEVQAIIDSATA
jgi:hypothetical protein